MMKLIDLLAPLEELFRRKQIPYALIGAYAVVVWGELRATRDIDLLCDVGDLGSLAEALLEARFRFERWTGDLDDPVSEVIGIGVAAEEGKYEIDILAGIRGAPRGIVQRARQVKLENVNLPVASPEDIILPKLLAGSPKDLDDARGIIRLQKGRLDLGLLRDLCPPHLAQTFDVLLLE